MPPRDLSVGIEGETVGIDSIGAADENKIAGCYSDRTLKCITQNSSNIDP